VRFYALYEIESFWEFVMMPSFLQSFLRWGLIITVALIVGVSVENSRQVVWVFAGILTLIAVSLTRMRLEGLVIWYVVFVSVVHLVKRMLFIGGPVDLGVYHQVQGTPYLLLLVMLGLSVGRFSRLRWVAADFLVATFFLLGAGYTIWQSAATGSMMEGLVSLVRYSGATLGYYVGRTLNAEVWLSMRKVLFWIFGLALILALWQFAMGPTPIDCMWARCTADSSIQAYKVVASMAGIEPMRAYATFADPLAWGLFVTFVWMVAEAASEIRKESTMRKAMRRIFFLGILSLTLSRSCVLAGGVMLFFHWMLRIRMTSRPLLLLSIFAGAFCGVVWIVEYLLENVLKASWFPEFASPFLSRMLDVGTLTQRGYAIDEWVRAVQDYAFSGVGWHEQASLTLGIGSSVALFQSHNGIISLMLVVGVPGLALVVAWFFMWMQGVTRALEGATTERSITLQWAAAMVFGYASTLFVSGQQFMNEFFWLVVGWSTTMTIQTRGLQEAGAAEEGQNP